MVRRPLFRHGLLIVAVLAAAASAAELDAEQSITGTSAGVASDQTPANAQKGGLAKPRQNAKHKKRRKSWLSAILGSGEDGPPKPCVASRAGPMNTRMRAHTFTLFLPSR